MMVNSTEYRNRMQVNLLSGISSRTQIDAQGKVKHLFEITQGSGNKVDEKDGELLVKPPKLAKEHYIRDRKKPLNKQ